MVLEGNTIYHPHDQQTQGPTDKHSYSDGWTHLKKGEERLVVEADDREVGTFCEKDRT